MSLVALKHQGSAKLKTSRETTMLLGKQLGADLVLQRQIQEGRTTTKIKLNMKPLKLSQLIQAFLKDFPVMDINR